jgi:hypothetical protein
LFYHINDDPKDDAAPTPTPARNDAVMFPIRFLAIASTTVVTNALTQTFNNLFPLSDVICSAFP